MSVRALVHIVAVAGLIAWLPAFGEEAAHSGAAAPLTREQVKTETVEFLRGHRWDETSSEYVPSVKATRQASLRSRAEVIAERESFLREHRWDEAQGVWQPIGNPGRTSPLRSRAQVKAETAAFLQSHFWDDETSTYVERKFAR